MTNIAPPKLLTHLWKSTLVSGVLTVVLGVLVLMWPGISIIAASVIFGVYLLVSGVAQVIFAFSPHVGTGARILLFLSGAASLILAVLAFRHLGQEYAILLLAIWIAVDGIGHKFTWRSRTGLGDLRWGHQHHRRCRRARVAVRFDRRTGSRRRDLAGRYRLPRNRVGLP